MTHPSVHVRDDDISPAKVQCVEQCSIVRQPDWPGSFHIGLDRNRVGRWDTVADGDAPQAHRAKSVTQEEHATSVRCPERPQVVTWASGEHAGLSTRR